MTKEEQSGILAEMLKELRETARFSMQDFLNKHGPSSPGEERVVRLLVWLAIETLREEDGIDFGPIRGFPGYYERKAWDQIEKRAAKQRAKGSRAHARAILKMRIAQATAPDEVKERIGDAADRLALRMAMRPRVPKI